VLWGINPADASIKRALSGIFLTKSMKTEAARRRIIHFSRARLYTSGNT
jgi:hypothetical protein